MAVSKVCKKLHLRCLTGFWQGFNTLLELCDLFASAFVWDSLNILIVIINYNNVLNILLKIENNSLKQYIAAQISENYYT